MIVLVVNCGSSSVKFQVLDVTDMADAEIGRASCRERVFRTV